LKCLLAGIDPLLSNGQMTTTIEAIEATARDYIEGWFTADATRMARALHPLLAKHSVARADGATTIETLTRDQMIAATLGGGGQATAAEQVIEVDDIQVEGDIASARVTSTAFIDFLHLARDGRDWRIINAVWLVR
jgi:hypothetical protein